MIREGGASSPSKSSRSTCVASREYRLKLTPACSADAPNGALRPIAGGACLAKSSLESEPQICYRVPFSSLNLFLAAHFTGCRTSACSHVGIPQGVSGLRQHRPSACPTIEADPQIRAIAIVELAN